MYKNCAAKVHVFSDSVLCLGKMKTHSKHGGIKKNWFTQTQDCREMDHLNGEPFLFEWMIFPGTPRCSCSKRSRRHWNILGCSRKLFQSGSFTCPCPTTSTGHNKNNEEICYQNARTSSKYAERFPKWHWTFLCRGDEKWYGALVNRPVGGWNKTAGEMMLNFAESGHPVCRGTSPLDRGTLKK